MKTLTLLNIERTYNKGLQEYTNARKHGLFSLAEQIANTLCELENNYLANDGNLNDLLFNADESFIAELEQMEESTQYDYLNYLKGYTEIG